MASLSDALSSALAGTGECGKSTILKQMQILSGAGFTLKEKAHFREIIHANILESLQSLVRAACDDDQQRRHAFAHPDLSRSLARQLLALSGGSDGVFPSQELIGLVDHFWQKEHAALQQAIQGRTFTVLDSATYFLDNAARCLQPAYAPTDQDIIRARIRTTGVNEFTLRFQHDTFMFIDVGGQRGERKKWRVTHTPRAARERTTLRCDAMQYHLPIVLTIVRLIF